MMPIATLVSGKVEDNYYTPDMPDLYSKRRHLLFVYGTLKKGFNRHGLLLQKKPLFVGDGWTVAPWFNMEYTKGKNPYPIVLKTDFINGGKIHGEVYLVPPETIVQCDFYESNGTYYNRMKTAIDITNANNPTIPLTIGCWIYEGNQEYWAEYKKKQTTRQADPLKRNKDGKKYFTFMKKYANGTSNATLRSM
ncbi:gamma-glutamylcyclotransferase family protein [Bradyrhizobium erythrophlei]|uniref:Gamma-glutamylcyclotransferase family protein n=1 Tax=Bradyrhizobium erythrophlei TaxID=1437360 RepID=A0A1M5TBF5_9BRAD|nr:gamma-glutamylcyclotransferase family protein [Bradyrhizobium erythrophlei]SHH47673.1 Gamma-glutamyl cyclotransferase, AIG2-like [Bradyrhizobium erythrophlei]